MQFSIRKLFVLVAVIAVLLLGGKIVYRAVNAPGNAYATWGIGDVIIEYMDENEGRWPKNWEELDSFLQTTSNQTTMGGSIADLRRRIVIDFEFEPTTMAREIGIHDDKPNFRPIRLRTGGGVHFKGLEPNQRIFDYLKNKRFGAVNEYKTENAG